MEDLIMKCIEWVVTYLYSIIIWVTIVVGWLYTLVSLFVLLDNIYHLDGPVSQRAGNIILGANIFWVLALIGTTIWAIVDKQVIVRHILFIIGILTLCIFQIVDFFKNRKLRSRKRNILEAIFTLAIIPVGIVLLLIYIAEFA